MKTAILLISILTAFVAQGAEIEAKIKLQCVQTHCGAYIPGYAMASATCDALQENIDNYGLPERGISEAEHCHKGTQPAPVAPDQEDQKEYAAFMERLALSQDDVQWLAYNILFEAGDSRLPDSERYAVAHVTLNRLHSGCWQSTISAVVQADRQFSWTLERHKLQAAMRGKDVVGLDKAERIAREVLSGESLDNTGGADHYHTKVISPAWAQGEKPILQLAAHKFYKLRGNCLENQQYAKK